MTEEDWAGVRAAGCRPYGCEDGGKGPADISRSLQRKGFSAQRANAIADAIAASLSGSELTARQQKYLRFADVDPRIRETMQEAAMGSGSAAVQSSLQSSRFRESVDRGLAKAAAATGAQITTAKTDDAKTAADTAASTEITSIGMARAHTADGAQTGAVFPSDAQTGTPPGSVEQQTESRSKTTQDILLQAESIIGTQSLSKGEQDALYRYQQQSARLDALKQQRDNLRRQLQTGTRLDVSAARSIQNQIKALDAEIAKADAALYAAKNSKQLSGVKQKAQALFAKNLKYTDDFDTNPLDKSERYDIMQSEGGHSVERSFEAAYADADITTDGSHIQNGKLKPNVVYRAGEHGYLYETNSNGLVVRVCTDDLQRKIHEGRLPHNSKTYGKLAGDHAGHLIGDQFGGSPELDNLVSQAKLVNLSKYKIIENIWAKALRQGKSVRVGIELQYDGGTRPTAFVVSYVIDGQLKVSTILNSNSQTQKRKNVP